MCTNFVLIKNNGSAKFAERLGVDAKSLIYGDFRPASKISIIVEEDETRKPVEATWWLYLQKTAQGYRPHPDYFSVNTNHKKLKQKPEYKSSRCIIPVSAFTESQDGKNPHMLEPADGSVMGFGGLYKTWTDKDTGEQTYSASIITLEGHPLLENIHRKSTPMWLNETNFDRWLDSQNKNVDQFDSFLSPTLHSELLATPIDRVMSKKPISTSIKIC